MSTRDTADRIEKYAEQMGLDVARYGSGLSSSQYLEVSHTCEPCREGNLDDDKCSCMLHTPKIRVSTHELPPTYAMLNGDADFEVGPHGGDWYDAMDYLARTFGMNLPSGVKAAIKRIQTKAAKRRAADEAARAKIQAERDAEERAEHNAMEALRCEAEADSEAAELYERIQHLQERKASPETIGKARKRVNWQYNKAIAAMRIRAGLSEKRTGSF